MKKIEKWINKFFKNISYVFIACSAFLAINLIFDGTLFQIFNLNRDEHILDNRIQLFKDKNEFIKQKIKRSSDPEFIKDEALERLDFVREGDLIFIFPEDI